MEYIFEEAFGYGPKYNYSTTFSLELSDEQISFLKSFLKENGDCDYSYIEETNKELFEIINDAANDAVLEAINQERISDGLKPIDFLDVDWENMGFDFIWPKELLEADE